MKDLLRQHLILRMVSKFLIPYILLFALYVQFHGDYGPGGGFQAGVIFASGLILYALIFSLGRARAAFPDRWIERCISLGVLIYGGTGLLCLLRGGNFLDYSALDPHDPIHGQHLGILFVELGVGLTVTAAMVAIFFAFADRERA